MRCFVLIDHKLSFVKGRHHRRTKNNGAVRAFTPGRVSRGAECAFDLEPKDCHKIGVIKAIFSNFSVQVIGFQLSQ